jgi:hypothetical protein
VRQPSPAAHELVLHDPDVRGRTAKRGDTKSKKNDGKLGERSANG